MSLKGRTILVTRQQSQAAELIAEIERRRGRAVVIPMIQISDPVDWHGCDSALKRIGEYDAIVFASANAVDRFLRRSSELGIDNSALNEIDLYAVGDRTGLEMNRHNLKPKFVPRDHSSDALGVHLLEVGVQGKKFLVPKGNLGSDDFAAMLRTGDALVDCVEVYRNCPPEKTVCEDLNARLAAKEFDVVTFASPSAVNNFSASTASESLSKISELTRIAVIGPTTRKAVENLRLKVDIEAKTSTSQGLVDAICNYYDSHSNY